MNSTQRNLQLLNSLKDMISLKKAEKTDAAQASKRDDYSTIL